MAARHVGRSANKRMNPMSNSSPMTSHVRHLARVSTLCIAVMLTGCGTLP